METSNPTMIHWSGTKKELTVKAALCFVIGIPLFPLTCIGSIYLFPLGLLLLVVDVAGLGIGYKSVKKLREMKRQGVETFEDYLQQVGFVPSLEYGRLIMDEQHEKFLVKYLGDIVIHDFSEIETVEIIRNGKVYTADGGVFRDALGNAFSGAPVSDEPAADGVPQDITSLSVTVNLQNASCPSERISYINSGKIKTDSPKYSAMHESAQKVANLLLSIVNPTVQESQI